MKETEPIDAYTLLAEAKNLEHKEAYRVQERSRNYRIGVGARLTSSGQPSFFLEALIYLCPNSPTADLTLLEKDLMFMRDLQERGYSLSCQDGSYISCEITVPPQNLATELETIKSTTGRIFQED